MSSDAIDSRRVDERLISLDIDHCSVSGPVAGGPGDSIGTADALEGCHLDRATKLANSVGDSVVVRQNHDSVETDRFGRSAVDMLDQWAPGKRAQRFAAESAGGVAGWYGSDDHTWSGI